MIIGHHKKLLHYQSDRNIMIIWLPVQGSWEWIAVIPSWIFLGFPTFVKVAFPDVVGFFLHATCSVNKIRGQLPA